MSEEKRRYQRTFKANWRKRFKEISGVDYSSVNILIPSDLHRQLKIEANHNQERVGVYIGRLVALAHEALAEDELGSKAPDFGPTFNPIAPAELQSLFFAIMASRFPGDTGSTRARLVAVVAAVNAVEASRKIATAATIADQLDASSSVIQRLASLLVARGVLVTSRTVGRHGHGAAQRLQIAPDALRRFAEEHHKTTGQLLPYDSTLAGAPVSSTAKIDALVRLIFASRFPMETGSTRARLAALIVAINALALRDEEPTIAAIGRVFGAPNTVVSDLVTSLELRGVLQKRPTYTRAGRKANRLDIVADPVNAINEAHKKLVGKPIGD